MITQNKLISYALDFISFLIENDIRLKRAILFGSVVAKEFDKESDIDIFLETEENDEIIQKLLNQFEKTKGGNWKLKGIENQISLKIGSLKKWPQLRRSMQSHGLVLYGSFKEMPEKVENYIFFLLNFDNLKRAKKVNLWRKLYGYTQKIKDKRYTQKGLVAQLGGKKLERGVVGISSFKANDFKRFLIKNNVKYKLIEVWTDSF